ncbi:hypothetical protein QUH28_27470 [Klebsiella pneumoniae]|nr:hypothetical protein [Klebsiella pneumoniae]MDM7292570.1 hypothetical protein [Klebsiella pneumoniae]
MMGDDTATFHDLYPGWFKSYKADIVQPGSQHASARYSRGNGQLPKNCRIVFFHGLPRPRQVSEPWIPGSHAALISLNESESD